MNHQYQLKKPLYRNWVKGGLAYKYLRDGLKDFADDIVHQEHKRLLQQIQFSRKNICSHCSLQTLKPKHGTVNDPKTGKQHCPWNQTRCNCLFKNKQVCPENICDDILDEILKCHASTPPAPNWKNTCMTDWCTHPWEVAKCFINAPGYHDKRDVSEIDIVGLLHVFINNKTLHSHLTCHINGNDVFYKTLRGRNVIFHSPTMELSHTDLIERADDIIALLEDEKELKANCDSQTAVTNIKELKKNDIWITTKNEADVFIEAMDSINNRTQELKELIQNANSDLEAKCAEASNTLEEKSHQIIDGALQSLEDNFKLICEKVRLLEIDNADIKTNLSLMRKRLGELERLELAHRQQQKSLEYVTQKQELQDRLLKLYQKDHVKTWISPLITRQNNISISKSYVPPKMFIEETPARTSGSDLRRVESYHQIFCAVEDEKNENSRVNRPVSNHFDEGHGKLKNIYILGEVGTGKSAFCKMMINTWCNSLIDNSGVETMNEDEITNSNAHEMRMYEFLFYVPMCYIPYDVGDIQSMIKHSLHGIALDCLIEELFLRESERCLILIDGLDEWTPSIRQCRFRSHATSGIPNTNSVLNTTIITTSRPSAHGILNMRSTDYDRKIQLVGIDETEIKNMAKLYITAHGKGLDITAATEDFIKKLQESKLIHPEKKPLILQQVIWMYCNGREIDKSVCRIYINILNIMFAWFEEK